MPKETAMELAVLPWERQGRRDKEGAIYYNKMCTITCYLSFIDCRMCTLTNFILFYFFQIVVFKILLQFLSSSLEN